MLKPRDCVVYDCEIINAIPSDGCKPSDYPDIDFAGGWEDYSGLGISVICAHDFGDGISRVFLADNLSEFADLISRREYVVGFNSLKFDDNLCRANGIQIQTTYDLYKEVKKAAGIPENRFPRGYSLNAIAAANLPISKNLTGDLAPIEWQRGNTGKVIDYCLRDVAITVRLLELAMAVELIDPCTQQVLSMPNLFDAKHGGPQARLF